MIESKSMLGLNNQDVLASRKIHGSNKLTVEDKNHFFKAILAVVLEPLFLILVGVAIIYFVLGQNKEAFLMVGALIIVSGISIFQEQKSRTAVAALKKLSTPKAKVIRNGLDQEIISDELVIGDLLKVADGSLIPADAEIILLNDFSVNESILTGESLPILKSLATENNKIFQGTLVLTGSCVAKVIAVGNSTNLGKIGKAIGEVVVEKTPLQIQIHTFVKYMIFAGAIAFVFVFGINYFLSRDILNALLRALTLAMSIIPEEIPVALSTFMALGAYRMYQNKVIVRNANTVETLGAATVICVDKTGTLTENRMELAAIYEFGSNKLFDYTKEKASYNEVINYALWSSETDPFDNMEKSIHDLYASVTPRDQRAEFDLVHEYPLAGNPPIMTHVFQNKAGEKIIAVKGSVEGVIRQSNLTAEELVKIHDQVNLLTQKGYRILGVGFVENNAMALPKTQEEFEFKFLGLLAFYDPPRKNIQSVLQQFYDAGIEVKMITGDHTQTAISIANQVQFKIDGAVMNGAEVMAMDQTELAQKVKTTNLFARMFPEAKLKIIEALKSNGEIVAMTGDGVNDGPALKAAHIGIAMGLRGSEVARNTASLIIVDDDLSHMVEAIALGRRIYENLKKAIRYILSIHIPIILIVSLPFLFFDPGFEIFTPVHVIFLELIMGPTCSIIFENEPIEVNSMKRRPRLMKTSFFSFQELRVSIIQGLVITITCIGVGYYFDQMGSTPELVRTLVFSTLVFSNLFLTLANRSFVFSMLTTLKYKNKLIPFILITSLLILFLALYIPAIQGLFHFNSPSAMDVCLSFFAAFLGVIWIEFFKLSNRRNSNNPNNHSANLP
jgi:Ca2+-transporting ATPase